MRAIIRPGAPGGAIEAPPSKSMAHRLLLCAGLADGISTVSNIAMSEDIKATLGCLRALGADIREKTEDREVNAESSAAGKLQAAGAAALEIRGIDPAAFKESRLDCGESGSTLRFMIPVAAMSGKRMTFSGRGRLMSRPLSVYEDIFKSRGLLFEKNADELTICGRLRGGEYEIRADISSQFISGLLLALPLAEEDSIIRLSGSIESRPYMDMTMQAMSLFGVHASWKDDRVIGIEGGQSYKASDVRTEGDWSNAACLTALGAEVFGLDDDSLQGDKVCREHFRSLDKGCAEIDISDCPDLGPILMAYAASRSGCVLTGTDRLRIKESDRGSAMRDELSKFGVSVETGDDRITVGRGAKAPDAALFGHNDHRIVMALAALCCITGGVIEGAEAVNKSFPDYFERIREAGAKITLEYD